MITEQERKYIETIIWRTNREVILTMKQIPSNELFGWKGEKSDIPKN